MKILICPDSFKESLSAGDAALAIRKGILKIMPDAECKIIPMADGGEGTVDALIDTTDGRLISAKIHDPLMREIKAFIGIINQGQTAIIETASAAGLALLLPGERNPLKSTSFGVGELVKQALDSGCKEIIVGLGGSATLDAGIGMAKALGARFTDKQGNETGCRGEDLMDIMNIDLSGLDKRLKQCKIYAACDVKNPLTGSNGAALVYGPQKGASENMARQLDENLRHFAKVIRRCLHTETEDIPGSGAAGGLGGGLLAFLNAELKPGFEFISNYVHLKDWIQWSDLVITGEGKIDSQTTFGKTPAGVAQFSHIAKKPVIAFTGAVGEDAGLFETMFDSIIPITDKPMSMEQSIKQARQLLENAAERVFRIIKLQGISSK